MEDKIFNVLVPTEKKIRIKGNKRVDEEEKIYARAVNFSTIRPRSEREIRDWFKRKKVIEEVVEVVFNRLKNLDLVNDLNFAKWWIEQRQTFRPKSKRFIAPPVSKIPLPY